LGLLAVAFLADGAFLALVGAFFLGVAFF